MKNAESRLHIAAVPQCEIGVGRVISSPSLQTVRADLPHTAIRSMVFLITTLKLGLFHTKQTQFLKVFVRILWIFFFIFY